MLIRGLVLEIVQGTDELELAIHGELMRLSLYSSQILEKLGSLLVWSTHVRASDSPTL